MLKAVQLFIAQVADAKEQQMAATPPQTTSLPAFEGQPAAANVVDQPAAANVAAPLPFVEGQPVAANVVGQPAAAQPEAN